MAERRYAHADLGLAFTLSAGWIVDSESTARAPLLLSLRSGQARIMLVARADPRKSSASRAEAMIESLVRRGIAGTSVLAPFVAGTGDVIAIAFTLSGDYQQWVSVCSNGLEITLTHTQDWAEVQRGVEQLLATLQLPSRAQANAYLAASATPSLIERVVQDANIGHFERLATRFNIPPAPSRKGRSR